MTGWTVGFLVVWLGLWAVAWRLWRSKDAEAKSALDEVSRLQHMVRPLNQANERLEAENRHLRDQAQQWRGSTEEIQHANQRIRLEAERLVALDSELRHVREQVELETNRLQDQEKQIQAQERRIKATAKKQQTENTRLEKEAARLQAEDARLKSEEARLQTIDARLQTEAERQMIEHQRLEAEEARLRRLAAHQAYVELDFAMSVLASAPEYLAVSDVATWQATHAVALDPERLPVIESYLPGAKADRARDWHQRLARLPATVRSINQEFITRRLVQERVAFDRVETNPLTERQRQAIVTMEDTTLVIAGAGTGKTSTIIGRVDYLIRRGLAQPEEILVLAYNKSAAAELRDRLDRLGVSGGATINTFHALGLQIIGESRGKKPSLSPLAEDSLARQRFIRDRLAEMLANPVQRNSLVSFFTQYAFDETPIDPAKSTTLDMVREELRRDRRALTGQLLKSGQEVKIANWLTLNGVAWRYEPDYPFDTASRQRRQYRPDFYLPDYDLYLEHFGIDRNRMTAPYVDQNDYLRSMRWKQRLHKEHGTRLVGTYSYFDDEGGLTYHLERILREAGVETRPLTDDEISELLAVTNSPISNFVSLIDQFLALFQGSGADRQRVEAQELSPRDQVFLEIFWPIYEAYRAELSEHRQIDFDDMLNVARLHIQSGEFRSTFTHIIIDEFQDISPNRLGLVLDLRAQHSCRFFFVGDDWQSIYRFAGSDVGIITHLAKWVGATERVDLDITFRYPQELLDLSTRFVTSNPAQLQKHLRSHHGASEEPPVAILLDSKGTSEDPSADPWHIILEDIVQRAATMPRRVRVLIIGRYNNDKPKDFLRIKRYLAQHHIGVDYSTAHSAKGQEADFVVVVEVQAGIRGFPSGISDDSVLRLVLTAGDESFPHAEERRLFYVALTRARKRLYLIAPQDNASPFLRDELLTESYRNYVQVLGQISERYRCPRCTDLSIRFVNRDGGGFWGCANWPVCNGRLTHVPVATPATP